jgi:hypothetical protein
VGVPEEDVVLKQDGAGCNRSYGGSDEFVVRKQDSNDWIRIRRWL